MSIYTPDSWVILEVGTAGNKHYRVLCSWGGGYLGSDSWKLSSGIMAVEDCGEYWNLPQHSGSVYRLGKHSERMSGIMSGIFASFVKTNQVKLLDFKEFEEAYKTWEI